jgi:gliding motility-associated-like protein
MRHLYFLILLFCICFVTKGMAQTATSTIFTCDGLLQKFDYSICNLVPVGFIQQNMADIAITPSGKIYATDFSNLYEIDTTTAATTYIGAHGTGINGINSLMALSNQKLIAVDVNSGGQVYTINVNTGLATNIGSLGLFPAAGDITAFNGLFYVACGGNQLVSFALNSTQDQVSNVNLVGIMNTQFTDIWGIVTVAKTPCSTDKKMLAFERQSVYEVNPSNAFCNPLCLNVNAGWFVGAASIAEIDEYSQGETVIYPNVFTPNKDNINDLFIPVLNVATEEIELQIYSRWGNMLHTEKSRNPIWNGLKDNSTPFEDGTYYYIVLYTDNCGEKKSTSGFVQLITH